MADKEATVFIVDVGKSMGEKHHGRERSDLDWAMEYVWDKITSTVATGRKSATIGVLGLRTDDTANELEKEESFEHITVLQPISHILMPTLRDLRDKISLSHTDEGDAISALVIAIQMITAYCRKLKYRRKIVLVTNAKGQMDADDLPEITKKLTDDAIELVVLGVDFDDPEFGVKEEDKDPFKAANEATFSKLVEACNGVFGTLVQAISELGLPRIKPVRPVPSYRGRMNLGDPSTYDSAMCIDVERYPRTKSATVPSASQFVVRSEFANGNEASAGQSSTTLLAADDGPEASHKADDANTLASVKNARTYQVPDDSVATGKRDVEREELAKGYEYGRTAVPISESDENVTKLETKASLELVGFIPKEQYERYMHMTVSNVIIAQKANGKASMALSSVAHALFELDSYAVGRLVTKDDVAPVLVLLAPSIEPNYECLLDVQLPFAEDVRSYRFPPLDKVLTVSGKALTEHRNLPTSSLLEAMDRYVDSMDLSRFGTDEDGAPSEYMPMEDTFSPVVHRIDQVTRWRAVHPTEPLPPPYDVLTKFSNPPEELLQAAQPHLNDAIAAANVKKVPPKQKGRKRNRDQPKPLSGLNVDELLGRQKRTKIAADNAIPEFKQMLATTEDPNAIEDAAKQMSGIITAQIKNSFGDIAYARAVEALSVMREELTGLEEPAIYNVFIKDLKRKLLAGELGGNRREMWWELRKSRLGLIDKKQSSLSEVTEEEGKEFLSAS